MAKSRLVYKGLNSKGEETEAHSEDRVAQMSPEGALGLPELLERRRLEIGITDGAFAVQPYNDTVLVYQLSRAQGETFAGTNIVMPDTVKKREHDQTPQGVIVAAGLLALDSLRMNGMDLGHVVTFCRVAPWRVETDKIGGTYDEVLVFRVGDIVGSVDTAERVRSGEIQVRFDEDNYEHYYHDTVTGKNWHPQRDTALVPERS